MIDLYTFPTPNGQKVQIMLEELGLAYAVHAVDITRGEQFEPEFIEISPNGKIPAIVDRERPDGASMALAESGAILIYLAEKTGHFLPASGAERYQVLQWLMFQMGHIGPMFGQAHHFRQYAPERVPYAIDRYTQEAERLYKVVEDRLAKSPFLCSEYSIADIATYPWMRGAEAKGVNLEDFPNLKAWMQRVADRPAVHKGMQLLKESAPTEMDAEAKKHLFGQRSS